MSRDSSGPDFFFKTGIGQDSHQFVMDGQTKPCVLGGVHFEGIPGLQANSDGDVVLHALCNAISSLSAIPVLGAVADRLCLESGVTNSEAYVVEAIKTLGEHTLIHVSITIEALRPKMLLRFPEMQRNIARILKLEPEQIGITATSGEGLTRFGCGDGVQAFCVVSAWFPNPARS